jgi:hypothetical protein
MIALATTLALAQAPAWPPCDDPDLEPRTECVLQTGDSVGWLIGFDYSPDANARTVEIIVTGADGAPFQSFELALERGFRAPMLTDLDGDRLEDVLLPLSTGLVNSDWAVFFGDFTGLLEADSRLNGHTVKAFEAGLFAVHARSNAAQHFVTIYRREGASLTQQAVVSVEFEEDGAECRLVRADDDRGEEFYCNAALIH